MKEGTKEIVGGVCSAAVSSFCCWGPLLLGLFGLGSAGLVGAIAKLKWLFIILAVVMLGRALALAYQRQNRRDIIITWAMIVLAVIFIAFPYIT